jgi:radical SAM protein with 4Fe4S-binding SPASM domain
VLSNGTLIDAGIPPLFREWPPEEVEITLLGATAETHDRLTGVPGSFHRAQRGLHTLLGAGIRTALKAMIMRPNLAELEAMEGLARGFGVSFRIDASLFPRFNGDRHPLEFRLSPREAAAADLGDPERRERWQKAVDELPDLPAPADGRLFLCGAGQSSFHIDPAGNLTPCLMLQAPSYDLGQGSFAEGWASLAELPDLEAPEDYPCRGCNLAPVCGVCPAQSQLETGASDQPPSFCCELSQERFIMLRVKSQGEAVHHEPRQSDAGEKEVGKA